MRKVKFISTNILLMLLSGCNILHIEKTGIHPFLIQVPKIMNIAHAGGKGLGPENTLITLHNAVKSGADILEIDIHSTADSVLVLLHDHTVSRTTNGHGYVWNFTLEKLSQLDAGYYWTEDDSITFPFRDLGITIPSLQEVFTVFFDLRLNIDIKQDEPHIIKNLCHMIKENGMVNRVLIGSFIDEVLHEFRSECPDVATSAGMVESKKYYTFNTFHLGWLYSPSIDVFEVPEYYKNTLVINKQLIRGFHKKNIPIYVWTVNEKEDMKRFIKLGVDGIITDYPDRLAGILNKPI